MCNLFSKGSSKTQSTAYKGEEQWISQLDSKFRAEFSMTPALPWTTLDSGILAGAVRSVGGGGLTAGNVTFVTVHGAGFVHPSI